MNRSENMVRSLHQLFLLSQTDRCWPFGATKTEKQTWGPSYNPFITAPVSNQNALSMKQPRTLISPSSLCWVHFSCRVVAVSLVARQGQWWHSCLPAPRGWTPLTSALLCGCQNTLVPFSRSCTPKCSVLQHNWPNYSDLSTMAACIWLRGLDSDGVENILPQWQNQLRAVNYGLLQSVRQCERKRTPVSLHGKCI